MNRFTKHLGRFYAPLIAYVLVLAFGMYLDSQGRHGQEFVDIAHIPLVFWVLMLAIGRIENSIARKTVALLREGNYIVVQVDQVGNVTTVDRK